MSRWITLPLDEGERMPLSVGDRRRVRLADGEELDAIFEAGMGSSRHWFRLDEDGEAVGDGLDVVAVDVERKYGNRSGKNANTRRKLSATDEAWRLMDQVRGAEAWTDWARRALAREVARSLRLDEGEIAALFERDF